MKKLITQKHWNNIEDKLFNNGMTSLQRKNWMKPRFIVEEDAEDFVQQKLSEANCEVI